MHPDLKDHSKQDYKIGKIKENSIRTQKDVNLLMCFYFLDNKIENFKIDEESASYFINQLLDTLKDKSSKNKF